MPDTRNGIMDMDDDFMGEVEFDLSAGQMDVVTRAIELASQAGDAFGVTNPLIAIMQWWEINIPEAERCHVSLEQTLTEACRLYVLSKENVGDRQG
jgi:hypothetical protein